MFADVNETKFQKSSLLSIAPEIRNMIWKAVIDLDPILLIVKDCMTTYNPPEDIVRLVTEDIKSVALPLKYIHGRCQQLHQIQPSNFASKSGRSAAKSKGLNPISWLVTNRQIYSEATAILYSHLRLHICDALAFLAFLLRPPKSILRPSSIHSLSLCLKMQIKSDLRDGFSFARRSSHGWETDHRSCRFDQCMDCQFVADLPLKLSDQLPALRELQLRICFMFKRGQGNTRRVIGQLANGRPKLGQLYRPKDQSRLVYVNDGGNIEEFVDEFCYQRPLRIFGGLLEFVDVQFCTKRIEHNPRNDCPHPRDRCWCIRRSIDGESLKASNIGRLIEKRMMGWMP